MDSFLASLPAVNAGLNSISAFLIVCGYIAIRRRKPAQHQRFMVAAMIVSAVFLVSYLTKSYFHGTTIYGGTGWDRTLYLTILFSHLTLAIAVVPLVIITVIRGFAARFDKHRAIARWTFPIWLYVSVTGVLVYLMLRPWY